LASFQRRSNLSEGIDVPLLHFRSCEEPVFSHDTSRGGTFLPGEGGRPGERSPVSLFFGREKTLLKHSYGTPPPPGVSYLIMGSIVTPVDRPPPRFSLFFCWVEEIFSPASRRHNDQVAQGNVGLVAHILFFSRELKARPFFFPLLSPPET